jgi:hypothetical protein
VSRIRENHEGKESQENLQIHTAEKNRVIGNRKINFLV